MQVRTNYNRTFDAAKSQGSLKGIALEVFGIVCGSPGLTGGEIFRHYEKSHPKTTRARNEIAKRINDLANWGAIKTEGKTICPESGRQASRWVPTGSAPEKPAYKTPKAKKANKKTPTAIVSGEKENDLQNRLDDMTKTADDRGRAIVAQNIEITRLRAEAKTAESKLLETVSASTHRANEMQSRINAAEAKELKARQELADLKVLVAANSTDVEGYVKEAAARKGISPEMIVTMAVRVYQAFEAGTLVKRRLHSEEQKSPSKAATESQLQHLASRARFLLRFRRFLPKRLVAQAEATLAALQDVLTNLQDRA